MSRFEYLIGQKLDYIRVNPVKTGLVKNEHEYAFFYHNFYHQRKTKWNFLTHYAERI